MALLLRLNKAAPLTNAETDNNFIYLEGLCTSLLNSKLTTTSLLTEIKLVDGLNSGLDADKLQGYAPTEQAIANTIVRRDASGNFVANQITATIFMGTITNATNAQNVLGVVGLANGGTGATSISAGYVKSNGSLFSSVVSILGSDISGNISGLSSGVTGIIAIANGGTGAASIAGAQSSLGLIPGQTVQSYSHNLQNISGIGSSGLLFLSGTAARTLSITVGNCFNITNPDGATGNPLIELSVVDILHGGTGANNAASARTSLGVPASLDSILSGIPTAPTATFGTKTTQIATTEFVVNNSVPTGAVFTMASVTVPHGYLQNNGQLVSRTAFASLFAVIGTQFGIGDGTTSFQLPNITSQVGFISIIKT